MDWGTEWAYILIEFDFKTAGKPVVYEASLVTRTTLGDDAVFQAEATRSHYHEEKTHTVHSRPD